MRYENKRWVREGSHFYSSRKMIDLSAVRVLHTGVDTVKELYQCLLKQEVLEQIKDCYENVFDNIITIDQYPFLLSKSSKKAGYQWILRNNDIGIVVLLKSFYVDAELHGSHLKIEGSPHLINSMRPADYSAFTLKIAKLFANQIHSIGCAAHLAVDLKNWQAPADFEYALVTRAKRKMRFNGVSDTSFDLSECSAIYGDRQTYTFGSASSIQLCVYDKVTEAKKTDKIDYWERQWLQVPHPEDILKHEYKKGDKVTRIEGRLHHSVVQQFAYGTKDHDGELIKITNFEDLSKHLTALWHYVLNNFRLHHSTSYVDPLWQLLEEDIEFFAPAPDFMYKRGKKPPNDNLKRRTAIWLGNTCRLLMRKKFKAEFIVNHIISSALDSELLDYFGVFGVDGRHFLYDLVLEYVQAKYQKLMLEGIAA